MSNMTLSAGVCKTQLPCTLYWYCIVEPIIDTILKRHPLRDEGSSNNNTLLQY